MGVHHTLWNARSVLGPKWGYGDQIGALQAAKWGYGGSAEALWVTK